MHDSVTGHNEHTVHVLPLKTYFSVFAALMVLLFITVAAAYIHIPFPGANIAVALTVAVVKAGLVVLYFMHVKYGTKLTWLWAGLGFVWLLLMLGFFADYVTRGWVPAPGW